MTWHEGKEQWLMVRGTKGIPTAWVGNWVRSYKIPTKNPSNKLRIP